MKGTPTLSDLPGDELRRKRILVRVDFNVPLEEGGVADDTRIRRTLPTLRHLLEHDARLIVVAHLGRPGGAPDPGLSLEPVARRLGDLLERPVTFVDATVGPVVRERVTAMDEGEVVVVENTRFEPGEKANDPDLARALAELADVYVNDAFGAAHRAHASTAGVAEAMRERGGKAVAGFLMERELRYLGEALRDPHRPYTAILGGAKIGDKIQVIDRLLESADRLLVGGAMANTFLRALGLETGDSLVEEEKVSLARETMERAGDAVLLPVDLTVAGALEPGAETRNAARDDVRPGEVAGDIGEETRRLFAEEIAGSRTLVWNGPPGVFETGGFSGGTFAVARAMAEATDAGARTVVGGGDTAAAVEAAAVADRMTHVSTGGGAALELLGGGELPAVAALSDGT